jgi:SAM-dependent methyltransferase
MSKPMLPGRMWAEAHRGIYERQAAGFDRHRGKTLIERAWLDKACAFVPEGGRILDLGCGVGEPVARYLIERGYAVTGVDFAEAMLDLSRTRFPQARWICADMRDLDLGESFDAIVGWDSFFHLTEDEQRALIPRLAQHLSPGGAVLLTVGPAAGAVIGTVEGETVYHASLSREEYASLFEAAGLALVDYVPEDPSCDYHSVLIAASPRG